MIAAISPIRWLIGIIRDGLLLLDKCINIFVCDECACMQTDMCIYTYNLPIVRVIRLCLMKCSHNLAGVGVISSKKCAVLHT